MSSLRDLLATCAKVAFNAAGDIPELCLYRHGDVNPTYDTSTGEVLPPADAGESSVKFVFKAASAINSTRYGAPPSQSESPPSLKLIATAQATDFMRAPCVNDTFLRGLDTYVVLEVDDTAVVIYDLYVSRTSGGVDPTP